MTLRPPSGARRAASPCAAAGRAIRPGRPPVPGPDGRRWQRLVADLAVAVATAHRDGAPLALALFETARLETARPEPARPEPAGPGAEPARPGAERARRELAPTVIALLAETTCDDGRVYRLADGRAAVLLCGVATDAAAGVCQVLRDRLAELAGYAEGEAPAVGVAGLGGAVVTAAELVAWANAALLTARQRGPHPGAPLASVALA